MDYTEDNQNSAPGSVPAAKLNTGRSGPDSQSTTKRSVAGPFASSSPTANMMQTPD